MKLAVSSQIRAIDRAAIDKYGVPGVVLMENAARSIFEECMRLEVYNQKNAVIFCGSGNNGGDGFALARLLANDGAHVDVVLLCEAGKLKGDAKTNYDICVNMKIPIHNFTTANIDFIKKLVSNAAIIIDAILGTGVSGDLRSPIKEAVSIINESGSFVLSVDCPTGGNPDNGSVSTICVKADVTITLALMKPGLLLYPLAGYAGDVRVGGIGTPIALIEKTETGFYSLDKQSAAKLLPKRPIRSHKGTFGKAVIVAGSRGMTGAAAFCAKSAYRAGCGYVEICAPESALPIIQQLAPQAVACPLPEKDGFVFGGSVDKALEKINAGTVCLIGPGMGNTYETSAFVKEIIKNSQKQLIVDADALNAISLSGGPEILQHAALSPAITPHPLEMSRLCGLPVKDILDNTVGAAIDFSKKHNVITLLKDASSIITDGNRTYINNGACSALAKAGSGDILAGIIAGLAAQGLNLLEACALAAFIHSKSGALAALSNSGYSVLCDDIIENMAKVFNELA